MAMLMTAKDFSAAITRSTNRPHMLGKLPQIEREALKRSVHLPFVTKSR
jgi:hypothetical protein